MLLVLSMLMSMSAFAQDRLSNSVSVPVATTTPTAQAVRYNCCLHKDLGNSGVCQIQFVNGACHGQWKPVKNHKLCLAQVPGYNSGAPISSTVNLNQAYTLNPCPF